MLGFLIWVANEVAAFPVLKIILAFIVDRSHNFGRKPIVIYYYSNILLRHLAYILH